MRSAILLWHWISSALIMVHKACIPANEIPLNWDSPNSYHIVTEAELEASARLNCGICGKPLDNQ